MRTADTTSVDAIRSKVFHRYLDVAYPLIREAQGVHLSDSEGRDVIDASSGGALVTSLGHGDARIIAAAHDQAGRIGYLYNHHFTNDAQERLAARLLETAAPEMARVRFVSGGSEANETALRLIRAYHVERGDRDRWRIISPAQAYHGATMGALALTGRPHLQAPYGDYLADHLHISPSTWRQDPTGGAALAELDSIIEQVGPGSVAAFFCEPISGAALPAYSPPDRFWHGLAERRDAHGFLVCFDEIVTGIGRTGTWFAYQQLPIEPDIVTFGKGLGAGYAPIAGVLCRNSVYQAIAEGSREFEHGHTWDGAPLPCAVGLAVIDAIVEDGLIDRVRTRGPVFRRDLAASLVDVPLVREVRGRGYLFGVEMVDPRDGTSILPADLHVADLVDDLAYSHGVLVTSSHPNADGYASDQTVLAPAFTSSDAELDEMVDRFARALRAVAARVSEKIG